MTSILQGCYTAVELVRMKCELTFTGHALTFASQRPASTYWLTDIRDEFCSNRKEFSAAACWVPHKLCAATEGNDPGKHKSDSLLV